MDDKGLKKCKKKGCNNPVLDDKYCLLCNQKRKESRDKVVKTFIELSMKVFFIGMNENKEKKSL